MGRWDMEERRRAALLVVALVAVGCGDSATEPGSAGTLTGTVHAVGGDDVEGLWAVWRPDSHAEADSVRIGADGTFEIRPSQPATTGELLIDGATPRRFHPFLLPFVAWRVDGLDLLLIPREWTVRSGTHRGEKVPTPLDPAVDDDVDQLRYSYLFGQPEPFTDPWHYLLDLMAWPLENFPARVAFDRTESPVEITVADSAAIWAVLDDMEEALGLDMFEPAEEGPGVIRVIHDPNRWGARPLGGEPRERSRSLGAWAGDGPLSTFVERHTWLDRGVLWVGELQPLRLADGMIPWETVLIHEMLHVLGLGHTCRIPSPMGPCERTALPSAHDAAYSELLRETLRLARELDVRWGVMPSVIGERKVLLEESAALPRMGR